MQDEKRQPSPRVSVLIPAYNAQRYLEQAVRSVQAQTVTDLEILILDDGSQDDTAKIAGKLMAEDKRIRLYQNGENRGTAQTRNRGLTLCRGTYIALLDSDDFWFPRKLEVQLELAERKQADLVYCSYAMVDEGGRKVCRDFLVPESADLESMLRENVISCSTALLRRSKLEGCRFTQDYFHEDLALWLKLLSNGWKAVGTGEVLAAYRIHPCSRSSNKALAAIHRWRIYRSCLRLPLGKSVACFGRYAANGLRKYKRLEKGSGRDYAGFAGQSYGVQQHQ